MKPELDIETINKILHRLDDLSPILYQQIIGSNCLQDYCGIVMGLIMTVVAVISVLYVFYRHRRDEIGILIAVILSALMFVFGPLLLIVSISDLIQLTYFPDYYVMRHLL